ncbi:hypothetical protein [Candidatus Albibeggiatoa sp. nov. NOAA]|uniref:hypothetical protein n=1 Tax=Candidatus Albibeggiatoa sp. nov. NOAA TaxID=3162724 RepID=UPI003304F88C|nr:hypothetical protein [Thiotrichaceae bacterium]
MKYLLLLITLIVSPFSFADGLDKTTDLKPIELLLKVKYVDIENGFYGFETIEGRKYLPTNMPDSFKQEGLIIQVVAVRQPHVVGIHMWGEYIRIISIQMVDCEIEQENIQMICNSID